MRDRRTSGYPPPRSSNRPGPSPASRATPPLCAPTVRAGSRRSSPGSPARKSAPTPGRPPAGGPYPRTSGFPGVASRLSPVPWGCAHAARGALGTCRTWHAPGATAGCPAGHLRSRGTVPAGAVVSLDQPGDVQVVVEGGEPPLRRLPRQLRYLLLFRGHGFRSLRTGHVSSQQFRDTAPPSLRRIPAGEFPGLVGTMRRSDSLRTVPPGFA